MNIRIKYLRDSLIAEALFFACILRRGLFFAHETKIALGIICDGFFCAGIVLCGIGAISLAARQGAFDMLAYCVEGMRERVRDDFFEYRRRKNKKTPYYGALVIGAGSLAASVLMLILYSCA